VTSLNRVDLKAKFESGDAPQGSDYADLIDSFVALAETTVQTLQGNLSFVGGLSAASVTGGTGTFSGTVSAASVFAGNVWATNMDATTVSAQTVTMSTIAGPVSGVNVSNSINFTAGYIKETVASVACISTTQAAGYTLAHSINILRTVTTSQSDAVVVPGFYPGAKFTVINNTTGSAQIFPPVGGSFDSGSTNAKIDIGPRGGAISRVTIWCETSAAAHTMRGG